jgi:iron complex transport system ATP-binding protein
MTGLTDLQGSDLYELSDGQLQKATIARALAQDGPIMMLDEPLIHLDIPSKWEIMNLLKRTTVEKKKTIILATHELELSLEIADRIWLINKQGELIAGKPHDLVLDGTIAKAFNTTHYRFQDRHIFKSGI